jgi:protein-disulfide isomerase
MANQLKGPRPAPTGERRLTPKQQAAARRAQKRRRIQLLVTGGMVAVIAIIAIVIGLVVTRPTEWNAIPATATTDERQFEVGAADARVTLEVFGDYQCPACKQWHETGQSSVVNNYIKQNKSVKMVFKQFPFLDANYSARESHVMVEGAYCAADQKRSIDFHDALYNNQRRGENTGFWTNDRVKELAGQLKLDTNAFNQCMDSGKYRQRANQDAVEARQRGVSSTPSFFVNGQLIQNGGDFGTLSKALDEALASPPK